MSATTTRTDAVVTTEAKPGYKTTEFWVVAIGFALGCFQEAVGVFKVTDTRVTTMLGVLLSAYAIARGLAKSGAPALVKNTDIK
jgi:hypothetical protein